MATVLTPPTRSTPPPLLTWEAYMSEPETEGRYDIVEGVRVFMPGATYKHQRVVIRLTNILTAYEDQFGTGRTVIAPFDVLIRRTPKLQTRQPDLLFVSHERVQTGGGIPDVGPLPFAPELLVEIVSNSETQRILTDKIVDYTAIGVSEVWVIRPDARTVEVLILTPNGPQSVAVYAEPDAALSVTFPTLSVPLAGIFAA